MNDFNPKEMKKASVYLQEKLDESVEKNEHIIKVEEEEKKKGSKLKRFVSSIFKQQDT